MKWKWVPAIKTVSEVKTENEVTWIIIPSSCFSVAKSWFRRTDDNWRHLATGICNLRRKHVYELIEMTATKYVSTLAYLSACICVPVCVYVSICLCAYVYACMCLYNIQRICERLSDWVSKWMWLNQWISEWASCWGKEEEREGEGEAGCGKSTPSTPYLPLSSVLPSIARDFNWAD